MIPALGFLPWRRALPPPEPPLPALDLRGPRLRSCAACEVRWAGGPDCWICVPDQNEQGDGTT